MGEILLSLLQFKNVSYISDNKTILKDLSIDIESRDFISVVGPSGSGKSTFLKLCAHLISPTNGAILYDDRNIMEYNPTTLRKNIGYCFQTPYLFGESVMENISFPYAIRNSKVDLERAGELFELFNLNQDFLKQDVKKLSGGEKQRIALIRILLFEPKILLLDEVTSALDADNALLVEKAIQALHTKGTTILWITHNLEQSERYANKVLTIEGGEIKSVEVLK